MSGPLPLAGASARLRGKPGRPAKDKPSVDPMADHVRQIASAAARLMTIPGTAIYMGGISEWTIRDLVASGVLPVVEIPLPNGKALRRKLIDREDVDRLIERWKERV